jgi:hypothetical protein
MALLSYTITLGAAAAVPSLGSDVFASSLRIENEAGNALVKFGGSDLSATVYAGSVPADTATASNAVTLGSFPGSAIAVHGLYLLGTAGQKVHLAVVTP